jgi:hypothetical protein
MSDLISVVVGGVLAIGGGAGTQWYLHRLKLQDDRRQNLAVKFEEAVALIYEFDHWFDLKRDRITASGEMKPDGLSPYAKLHALAVVYFPSLLATVTKLKVAANKYEGWILLREQKRYENKWGEMNDGFGEAYDDFSEMQKQLLVELAAYAELELRVGKGMSLFSSK